MILYHRRNKGRFEEKKSLSRSQGCLLMLHHLTQGMKKAMAHRHLLQDTPLPEATHPHKRATRLPSPATPLHRPATHPLPSRGTRRPREVLQPRTQQWWSLSHQSLWSRPSRPSQSARAAHTAGPRSSQPPASRMGHSPGWSASSCASSDVCWAAA